jgi:hypothetical protein
LRCHWTTVVGLTNTIASMTCGLRWEFPVSSSDQRHDPVPHPNSRTRVAPVQPVKGPLAQAAQEPPQQAEFLFVQAPRPARNRGRALCSLAPELRNFNWARLRISFARRRIVRADCMARPRSQRSSQRSSLRNCPCGDPRGSLCPPIAKTLRSQCDWHHGR